MVETQRISTSVHVAIDLHPRWRALSLRLKKKERKKDRKKEEGTEKEKEREGGMKWYPWSQEESDGHFGGVHGGFDEGDEPLLVACDGEVADKEVVRLVVGRVA